MSELDERSKLRITTELKYDVYSLSEFGALKAMSSGESSKLKSTKLILPILLTAFIVSAMIPVANASASSSTTNQNANITKQTQPYDAGYTIAPNTGAYGDLMIKGTWIVPKVSWNSVPKTWYSYPESYEIGMYPGNGEPEDNGIYMTVWHTSNKPGYVYDACITWGFPVEDDIQCLSTSSYPISAGNTMQATITLSGTASQSCGTLTYTIKDLTKGWKFQTSSGGYCAGPGQTVYWILNSPDSQPGVLPWKFSTLKSSGDYATLAGHSGSISSFASLSSYTVHENSLSNSKGTVLAYPSALLNSGTSFDIYYV
jgi:hypothetical protein